MDSLSQLEGDVVYEVGSFFGSGANMSQGEEFLPSINNDFIPRRNHVEKLKHVFPSGFGAAVHRQPATKLNDEKFEHFDMSASIESLPVKGKLPEKFSFVQWAQGGDEHMDSPEKGKDSYAGVSGQFRRVPSRFRDMGEGQRVNHIREMHLEVDNRHLLKYTTKDEGKGLVGIGEATTWNNRLSEFRLLSWLHVRHPHGAAPTPATPCISSATRV